MASRRISLLVAGYFSGRLDFKEKTNLSRLREEFILNELEKSNFVDLLKIKIQVFSNLITKGGNNQSISSALFNAINMVEQFTLPYISKQNKMEVSLPTKTERESWKSFLDKRNELKNKMISKNV